MADMGRSDLGAVGSAATVSKKTTQGSSKTLSSFSVKKGDNGGVVVSETYESKPPAGRRAGPSYPDRTDYKENPFGPSDQAEALSHVRGLLSQMTGAPEAPAPRAAGMIETPGGSVGGVRGPAGAVARVAPTPRPVPMPPMPPYGGGAA